MPYQVFLKAKHSNGKRCSFQVDRHSVWGEECLSFTSLWGCSYRTQSLDLPVLATLEKSEYLLSRHGNPGTQEALTLSHQQMDQFYSDGCLVVFLGGKGKRKQVFWYAGNILETKTWLKITNFNAAEFKGTDLPAEKLWWVLQSGSLNPSSGECCGKSPTHFIALAIKRNINNAGGF